MSDGRITLSSAVQIQGITTGTVAQPGGQLPAPFAELTSGTQISGFVIQRNNDGTVSLRTEIGDLQIKSELFLKTGAELVLRIEHSAAGTRANIISVDGMSIAELKAMQSAPKTAETDVVLRSSMLPNTKSTFQPSETMLLPQQASSAGPAATPAEELRAEAVLLRASILTLEPQQKQIVQQWVQQTAIPTQNAGPNPVASATVAEPGATVTLRLIAQQLPAGNGPLSSPIEGEKTQTANTDLQPVIPRPLSSAKVASSVYGKAAHALPNLPVSPVPPPAVDPKQAPMPNLQAQETKVAGELSATMPVRQSSIPMTSPSSEPVTTPAPRSVPGAQSTQTMQPAPAATLQAAIPPVPGAGASPLPTTEAPTLPATVPANTGGAMPPPAQISTAPAPPLLQLETGLIPPQQSRTSTASLPSLPVVPQQPVDMPKPIMPGGGGYMATMQTANSMETISPSLPPPDAEGRFMAIVIGHERGGETIVASALGTLRIFTAAPPPLGTRLTLQLVTLTPPSAAPSVPAGWISGSAQVDIIGGHQWTHLEESIANLQQQDAGIAQQLTQRVIPNTGNQFVNGALFFLSALRGGDLRQWLGGDLHRTMEQKLGVEHMARLGADFSVLRQFALEHSHPEWQTWILPLMHQEKLEQARLYLRKEQGGKNANRAGGTRFIIELSLSHLGPMQLDGLVKEPYESRKQFDLIIRTHHALPQEIAADIRTIFSHAAEVTGMGGQLQFQEGATHFARPLEGYDASGAHEGSILA